MQGTLFGMESGGASAEVDLPSASLLRSAYQAVGPHLRPEDVPAAVTWGVASKVDAVVPRAVPCSPLRGCSILPRIECKLEGQATEHDCQSSLKESGESASEQHSSLCGEKRKKSGGRSKGAPGEQHHERIIQHRDRSTTYTGGGARCSRTDGKRWRCKREALPEQKYCEKHLHRGLLRKWRKRGGGVDNWVEQLVQGGAELKLKLWPGLCQTPQKEERSLWPSPTQALSPLRFPSPPASETDIGPLPDSLVQWTPAQEQILKATLSEMCVNLDGRPFNGRNNLSGEASSYPGAWTPPWKAASKSDSWGRDFPRASLNVLRVGQDSAILPPSFDIALAQDGCFTASMPTSILASVGVRVKGGGIVNAWGTGTPIYICLGGICKVVKLETLKWDGDSVTFEGHMRSCGEASEGGGSNESGSELSWEACCPHIPNALSAPCSPKDDVNRSTVINLPRGLDLDLNLDAPLGEDRVVGALGGGESTADTTGLNTEERASCCRFPGRDSASPMSQAGVAQSRCAQSPGSKCWKRPLDCAPALILPPTEQVPDEWHPKLVNVFQNGEGQMGEGGASSCHNLDRVSGGSTGGCDGPGQRKGGNRLRMGCCSSAGDKGAGAFLGGAIAKVIMQTPQGVFLDGGKQLKEERGLESSCGEESSSHNGLPCCGGAGGYQSGIWGGGEGYPSGVEGESADNASDILRGQKRNREGCFVNGGSILMGGVTSAFRSPERGRCNAQTTGRENWAPKISEPLRSFPSGEGRMPEIIYGVQEVSAELSPGGTRGGDRRSSPWSGSPRNHTPRFQTQLFPGAGKVVPAGGRQREGSCCVGRDEGGWPETQGKDQNLLAWMASARGQAAGGQNRQAALPPDCSSSQEQPALSLFARWSEWALGAQCGSASGCEVKGRGCKIESTSKEGDPSWEGHGGLLRQSDGTLSLDSAKSSGPWAERCVTEVAQEDRS